MNRSTRYILIAIAAVILLCGVFSGGVIAGWALPDSPGRLLSQNTPFSNEGAQAQPEGELFAPFWEAWDLVHEQYVDQPVDDVALMRGAISGMMDALGDKHSSYMDPQTYEDANADISGYEGIGAWMDTTAKMLTVTSPIPGSPAEKAGLKAGDVVVAVDGEDMTGVDPAAVRLKVLGPAGTPVTLTIQREGEEKPFDVTITRARITIPSVESKMLDSNIAYVRIYNFAETTTRDLKDQMGALLDQNPKGLVLDLRGNPGGLVNTAIDTTSQFLTEGNVMIEVFGDGTKNPYRVKSGGIATQIPMVVLVDEGSASASEIMAGAIQDAGRAKLVGVTTYGKGSEQSWIKLRGDNGAVRITVARWTTPLGRQINEVGLTPDVVVELTEEDMKAGKDAQLDKAVEVLLQGLK